MRPFGGLRVALKPEQQHMYHKILQLGLPTSTDPEFEGFEALPTVLRHTFPAPWL